jgi:protease-4
MSDWVSTQLEAAENDPAVKGLIVRIISPGGGVASSDQIHHAICRYKERTGQPVLAFMQSIAASGGYYSAVACDEIMAEPTVITGSIGVMMNHLVIKDLLEQKLGITPVTLKSGERKDWPSLFSETSDQQRQYLNEKLIQPAYERFVELVLEGRKEKLNEAEVRALADGSIFSAPEAMTKRLIDEVGYFDEAVDALSQKAGLTNPTVVEYEQELSVLSMLGAQTQSGLRIDTALLEKLLIPQLMYIWDGKQ